MMCLRNLLLGIGLFGTMVLSADEVLDKNQLLKELQQIQNLRKGQMNGAYSAVIAELTPAITSAPVAIDLYEKAVFANQFDGIKGDLAEFNKAKLQDAEKMRDPLFQATLQLHIEYLVYTLRKIGGQETSSQINDLTNYVQRIRNFTDSYELDAPKVKNPDALKDPASRKAARNADTKPKYDEFVGASLSQGPFAKYYQIQKQLDGLQDWELKPLESRGIEDKILFPELRNQKNKLLLELWDQRIEYERQESLKSGLAEDKAIFDNVTYPDLLWNRSKDLVATGDQVGGTKAMMSVLKTYPLHAKFADWFKEMQDQLDTLPSAPAAADTAQAAPASTPADPAKTSDATPSKTGN